MARWRTFAFLLFAASAFAHNWSAAYDGLGRRLRTTTVIVTNGVALTNQPKVVCSYFDPSAELLELGVKVGGKNRWKVQGPDLDGRYGGMNGTGGLDGMVDDVGIVRPVVSDARGNVHGVFDTVDVEMQWNTSRPTGYGAVPEYRPMSLADNGDLGSASAWRGRWPDRSGLYWLGARYYEPVAGRFTSCDPYGHDADPSLYAFADGDPINYFDSDGRIGKAYSDFQYNGGVAGYGLRGLADLYNDFGASSDNTYLAWNAYNAGSLLNMAAGMVTPASYVDAYNTSVDRSANVMAGELANGSGWTWAAGQGASSIVGDFVGYNNAFEAGFGVDRQTGEMLSGVDRATRGFTALSQMAGTTALGAMYNPTATLTPQAVPPAIQNAAEGTVTRYVGATEARIAQETGFIPNVDRFGQPKVVYVTPEAPVASASQTESIYQIGRMNPMGATAPPTHVIVGNPQGISFMSGGNVAGSTQLGTELLTTERIPVISVRPIGGH